MPAAAAETETWPDLSYAAWKDTGRTLHLWSQVVGKVRLSQTPWLNHSWQTPLYVTPRGLTTGLIHHARGALDLEFDVFASRLHVRTAERVADLPLEACSVADFYARLMALLQALDRPVRIHAAPNEMPEATPFARDQAPRTYRPEEAVRFFRVLSQADRVLKRFRTGFLGKASPVHFFWGSFDLAVTRFSGRPAPPHPGGVPHLPDEVTREAYSHEVSSAGFWPGGEGREEPVFYSYAYPEPPGFRNAAIQPADAVYDATLGEFLLPYQQLRLAPDPEARLMDFLHSTYAAAADLGHWDRHALECAMGEPGRPRAVNSI
ncbi:MAG: uncharacterized protein JWQ97_1868 [Phenylobacterium sp.]|nr:uncharacterized protein [Phenylobacterium sp.]